MRSIVFALLLLVPVSEAYAQTFDLPLATIGNAAELDKAMPKLAEQVLAVYQNSDRDVYLDNLFRLQLVAGRYAQAGETLTALQELRSGGKGATSALNAMPYEIYARAKVIESEDKLSFSDAYTQAFRATVGALDDITAAKVNDSIGSPQEPYGPRLDEKQADLRAAVSHQDASSAIALSDALDLLRKYEAERSFASYYLLTDSLVAEDDLRRYVVEDGILVPTPDGAAVSTLLMRPRNATMPLPTLLGFTIYANQAWSMEDARISAAHGYAAVVSYTRGKGNSSQNPIPLEHDGADASAVIDWISKQAWSDGRVGMYGGSYNGFTQWAAAKHLPPALKALMPSVTMAPGIDWPKEGNVYMNFAYSWLPYVMNNKTLDQEHYDEQDRWSRLNKTWYRSGQAYRALDRIDGAPNPVFQRWLDHPGYDAYWQALIPYRQEFAQINIPVLTTTGYYDGGQIGALYYFNEHNKYNAHAEHYLVVGPYNHIGAQRSAWQVLRGYQIDPVARIEISWGLRYQWFDYVFRGAPKPAILQDKVNYEVMGANVWKHAPSVAAMSNGKLRFHLSAAKEGDVYRLSPKASSGNAFVTQKVDFTDRSDVDETSPSLIIDKTVDQRNAIVFASDPMQQATEVSGLFSGQLDFAANKKDMDINVALYEQMADGRYFQLSWFMARASYIKDRTQRQLLRPRKRQKLSFTNGRTTSRLLAAGSRLLVVLSINKQPNVQINYGSGKDVSDETIADAGKPLQISWFAGSYIDIPVAK